MNFKGPRSLKSKNLFRNNLVHLTVSHGMVTENLEASSGFQTKILSVSIIEADMKVCSIWFSSMDAYAAQEFLNLDQIHWQRSYECILEITPKPS